MFELNARDLGGTAQRKTKIAHNRITLMHMRALTHTHTHTRTHTHTHTHTHAHAHIANNNKNNPQYIVLISTGDTNIEVIMMVSNILAVSMSTTLLVLSLGLKIGMLLAFLFK